MSVFIQQGDKPLTDHQIQKRTQAVVDRDWPEWKRERAMRTDPTELNAYMEKLATDTDTNRANNLFNDQLDKYTAAVERLSHYILADGRPEIIESQPTGEEVWNEDTQEMEAVMADVVVQTAVEPLEPTVERTVYSEDDPMAEPTVETIENPEITRDNAERAAAQAVVDNTPQAVKEAA
jgi:hypothetical protein